MSSPKLRWLVIIALPLSDMALAEMWPLSESMTSPLPANSELAWKDMDTKIFMEDSANRLVSSLAASLKDHVHLHQNELSCSELAAVPWRGEGFSHELLGLVMVPVLLSAGCENEGLELVMNLYDLLGQQDTQELLEEIVAMIKKDRNGYPPHSSSSPPDQSQLQAILSNIQQLADTDERIAGMSPTDTPTLKKPCSTAPPNDCKSEKEERVHRVVKWIPGVSTLYSLGTAVYYVSIKCSEIAKERALDTAVDLGTDALVAVTGGISSVTKFDIKGGVQTGVKAGIKYLINKMREEDD